MRTWLAHYRDYLHTVKRVALNTAESYERDVADYISFLEKRSVYHFQQTNDYDVRAYMVVLQERGRARSTLLRHLASLRSFYTYLMERGVVTNNPCQHISLPNVQKKEPRTLTVSQISRLLSQPNEQTTIGQRDSAMFELLYATGIRVSELISLKINDIDTKLGILSCNERVIPIGQWAMKSLERYLNISRPKLLKTPLEQTLFINVHGKPLTRQGFWKILKKYVRASGLPEDISPNVLRHSFAAHMLASGADVRVVQQLMGHAHVTSTYAYLEKSKARIKDTYIKYHPRARAH